ncbi:hypothetical protein EUTSA_v10019946mg [Eutrema salsugineum]|uniref:J domain-containing protein n=1 Tax=Eutrema salsugineum TaxID=72664 RepID=V4M0H7_EUTSA|nr:uncharacterized protein LOC18024482 [Eutrema salsugineum]ESQ49579.1 hypothetical protein EUTSA_v10019946mg [Eutrema salsugineum]
MDCNKEEAARAKNLAEKKMSAGDFIGAQKLVTKAQILFPELENILKMTAICDVHSSASKKIKGLDNWYGILQVQFSADALTIKKQYRKLALLLHPDKNKLAGAEAAFKLVGEANRILSDQIKRSQYDIRYRSHLLLARQSNANSGRHCSAANNPAENFASGHTFWTCCRNCGQRYKHLKLHMNKIMHCSTCQNSYVACNIGCDGVPPSRSAAGVRQFQDRGVPSRQNASTGAESESSSAEMDKNETVGGKLNKKNQANQKRGSGDRKPKKDEDCTKNDAVGEKPQKGEAVTNNSAEIPKPDVLKPQPEVDEAETSAAKSMPDISASKKNQAAKKRRKAVEESYKSFEFDDSDVVGATNRKSSRKKPQVSYAEGKSCCDFVSPPTKKTKPGCEFESGSNTKQTAEVNKSPELVDSGVSPASSHAYKRKAKEIAKSGNEDVLSAKNKESEGCDGTGADEALSNKIDKVENGFKSNENPKTVDIPAPEFNVFEAERKTENFAVNQVWSICDPRDGMPRKYARVKKVLDADFKLRITYLVPVRKKNDESIPVACGMFKNGESEDVEDRSIFSGQMFHSVCNRMVNIHPRKGEIWAVFRDWNEEWNSSPEKHELPYKYDFVEIVNDYKEDVGVGVAYLGKLKGFVSRFHWEPQDEICQIQFAPNEMLSFSHRVPAVKMTGKEKECVPAVSYELDIAALPKDISQVDAVDMGMDSETLKGKVGGPYPEAPKVEVKPETVAETAPSPRKRRKFDDDDDDDNGGCSNLGEVKGRTSRSRGFASCQVDEKKTPNESRKNGESADVFKLRKSPRLLTVPSQQRDEKKSAKQGNTPKKTDKGSLGIRKPPNGIRQPADIQEGESSTKQGRNCELPSLSKQNDLPTQLDGCTNDSPEITPVSSSCKTPRRNAFDFENQRSEDKFRVHQIWAIYSNDKGMPTEYVKIKKINTKPVFKLYVTHMELYPPSAETLTRPVSCGDFKLITKKAKIIPRTSFSHQVNPVDTKKNIVKVFPRKGEIWALYKNCDSTKEEHDIVEVVRDYCDGKEIAKAVALAAKGSSSPYMIQSNQGSNAGSIDIPKAEMSNRFSHQIPAKKHTKRRTRLGEEGYWELDPRAIPGRTMVLD